MSKDDREFSTRSEMNKGKRFGKKRNLDRLLNVLIAIVVLLIVINGYFIFSKNGEDNDEGQATEKRATNENEEEDQEIAKKDKINNTKHNNNQTEQNPSTNNGPSDLDVKNEAQTNVGHTKKLLSNDELVEEVIVDENWQPTPTRQTGEHISTYEEGHIDYEEKLETVQNAVNLPDGNIIFWSVRNNGGSNSSIAVVSSKDQSEKYRVSIEWVDNQGWKPVKIEKLKQLEESYVTKE